MMKRKCVMILLWISMIFILGGCQANTDETLQEDKITIVCTNFPLYDWTSQLTKGTDTEVILLLDNGMDMHSFQPAAEDLIQIAECDILVHVGGESDEWLVKAMETSPNEERVMINLMDLLKDDVRMEHYTEGMQTEHSHEGEGVHDADEHIWLSLRFAMKACGIIEKTLCQVMPEEAEIIQENTDAYCSELETLDQEYTDALMGSNADRVVVVADRFPFLYMMEDYELEYYAAFPGCSTESEADFETVIFLAERINEHQVKTIFITEGSTTELADAVIENTQEKDMNIAVLHSMQAVFQSDIENGVSYVNYMRDNLEALTMAL